MSLNELLQQLSQQGVEIWREEDKLRYRAPKGALTPTLKEKLKEYKAELLEKLRSSMPLVSVSRDKSLPLSFEQERLWAVSQLSSNTTAYNISQTIRLTGKLNLPVLQASLNESVRRHESLRTTIKLIEGSPKQIIAPSLEVTIDVSDYQGLSESEKITAIAQIVEQVAQKSFDLEQCPLFHFKLLHLGEEEAILIIVLHHIIADVLSVNILIQELATIYESLSQGATLPLLPELEIQYGDFAVWQRKYLQGEVLEKGLNYWKEQLANLPTSLELPTDYSRPLIPSFRGKHQFFKVPITQWVAIKKISQEYGVTPFVTLLAAFNLLLYQCSGQTDLVVGSPTSGRNQQKLQSLIGFFAYPLLLRNNLSGNPSFAELLTRVRQVVLEAYTYQDIPLSKVVETIKRKKTEQHNSLVQVLFSFLGQQANSISTGELTLNPVWEMSKAPTDLEIFLTLSEVGEELVGVFEYNPDLFNEQTIKELIDSYCQILQKCVDVPSTPIEQFKLTPALQSRVKTQKSKIAIAATFTAEPVEDALNFWLAEIFSPLNKGSVQGRSLNYEIKFASYNQVFQELLAPNSLLSENKQGINVVLVRLEDWQKYEATGENNEEKLERNVEELIQACMTAAQRGATPYLLCLCPASPRVLEDTKTAALYQRMEEKIVSSLNNISNFYLVTSSELTNTYPVADYYDPHGDEIGHIPYTPIFFSALATMVARKITALIEVPYKVILLDCDQTLWKGVCGEDGAAGVEITPPYRVLQELMVKQKEAGKLLCLCSKNQEEDVMAVFEYHQDMPLKKHDFVQWRINWLSKSENIKALAEELQLGLDSFIFIDDNPVECAEVKANCPEVLTLELPSDAQMIPKFLANVWAFDQLKITQEDKERTELYQQNIERESYRQSSLTLADFLAGIELNIEISEISISQIDRVSQLTQRTNQFNLTTIRRSEGEIKQLWESGKLEFRGVKVKDRFGDYGLVGLLIFECKADTLKVDTFLLSCRVLGRGVEHHMLAYLGNLALERGLSFVDVSYVPTQKNQPALDFLNGIKSNQEIVEGGNFRFSAQVVAFLTFEPESLETKENKLPEAGLIKSAQINSKSEQIARIATELYDASLVLKEIESQKQQQRPELEGVFVAPRNQTEELLATIWSEVLGIEKVGVNDNFFELGGHSLKATQIVSRLREAFNLEIPLRHLFSSPTIAELSTVIETAEGRALPQITKVSREENLPLSFAQERLWFLNQLEGDSATYNIAAAIKITGELNISAFDASIKEIVQRHEVLRTSFPTKNGIPSQVISPTADLSLKVVNLEELEETEKAAEVAKLAELEAIEPFDLTTSPLMRVTLLVLGFQDYVLLLNMHHIISDGWSTGVMLREVQKIYAANIEGKESPLPALNIQYADYAAWQRQWLSGEVLEKQVAYWEEQLAGIPPLLELPTDYPRPPEQSYQGKTSEYEISESLTTKLKELSQQSGTTLYMTLLAAFSTLLYRYTGEEDVVIGSPIANRNHAEIEELIGFFVNTLVMRTRIEGNVSYAELLKQVRKVTLEAMAHQDVPFEKLVERLQPERSLSHSPIFQVMFSLQNAPMGELELPGVTLTPLETESVVAKFDLSLDIEETDGKLITSWEYSTDLFKDSTIARMAQHFQTLLEAIVNNPQEQVFKLPILTPREQQQLLVEWNDTVKEYPQDKCIHQLFEEQVKRTPDAVAVVFEESQLTYLELNERANQLAHYLQKLGVTPEELVGICVERSLFMVIGLLGVLKAGGAYVPLDPAYPSERLAYMLEDAAVKVLLTQEKLRENLPEYNGTVVSLDADWEVIEKENKENLASGVNAENLAYIIYTSGSTGKPKGVMIKHQSLVNFTLTAREKYEIKESDRLLQFASISFDAAAEEIYPSLTCGSQLLLRSESMLNSASSFLQKCQEFELTVLDLPTAYWGQITSEIATTGIKLPEGLRLVIIGGEEVQLESLKMWEKYVGNSPELINTYGPTEATVVTTAKKISGAKLDSSIGKPINNLQTYILDEYLQPVPIGVAGELHIGGAGLARGYLNRPELTAEKFIPNPFSNEPLSRLYKTGDKARYLPDGNIEFLGRIDNQVKIRGFRIELGEIEARLTQDPEVKSAVVIAREDSPGSKRLVAYVVANTQEPSISELRSFLAASLPEYMVPNAFVFLEEIPLTPNGKIDRRALPAPDKSSLSSETYVPPRNQTEMQLRKIWSEVLGVQPIGVKDNFFELGGHSLLAVRLMAQIEQKFGKNLPLASLFQTPTIEKLATLIRSSTENWSPLVAIQPEGNKQPFFCVPGIDGQVIDFYELALHLDKNQPFYAFQPLGLDGKSQPHTRIEDIAAYYIEALKKVQNQGPYLLGGYSFGVYVAFEMAVQLQKQGDEVSLLVIFDTPAEFPLEPMGTEWDHATWITTMAEIGGRWWKKNLQIEYEEIHTLTPDEQLEYLREILEKANMLPPGSGFTQVKAQVEVIKANSLIYYEPQEIFPTRISLFRALESDPDETELDDETEEISDPTWGWSKFANEPVETYFVPGDHITMMETPHVQVLAERLKICLEPGVQR